ncbi:MAG TPA: hypothetical protein VLA00_14685 [Xanthobacteraceae bacterium]|nr:hypothetical protein [Xanthobacteraceae bacterium]
MTPRARAAAPELPPLLAWEEARRIQQLLRERYELRQKLARVAPRSLRRLDLERRIAVLTTEILTCEIRLSAGSTP